MKLPEAPRRVAERQPGRVVVLRQGAIHILERSCKGRLFAVAGAKSHAFRHQLQQDDRGLVRLLHDLAHEALVDLGLDLVVAVRAVIGGVLWWKGGVRGEREKGVSGGRRA